MYILHTYPSRIPKYPVKVMAYTHIESYRYSKYDISNYFISSIQLEYNDLTATEARNDGSDPGIIPT